MFEIVPPEVDTELGKGTTGEEQEEYRGIPPAEVAKATLAGLAKDEYEIYVGEARDLVFNSRQNFEQAFLNINQW